MNTPKRAYLPPLFIVKEVALESSICSGSVVSPTTKQTLTIDKQPFDTSWDTNADFSGQDNWTPSGSSND